MVGTDDIVIPPKARWLTDPAAQRLCRLIEGAGFSIYFVGGCVRNALLGQPDSDVDLSTDALPERVMTVAEAAGLKAVPTGIDHGTVTVVVDGQPFEVTTFRRDVETDGRRAVVAFSTDIRDDARRRDFTMNALYATAGGQVIDPLGGLDDLLAGRVRFIEDPAARIREDFLRILRFFRFSAWYADPAEGFDAEALAAISANLDGLETLSAERVGQEMAKLLAAPDPAPAVAAMRQTGVLSRLLPGADDRLLGVLVHFEELTATPPDWRRRLAVLGGTDHDTRLRLSKADARMLELLAGIGFQGPSLAEIAYRHGADVARSVLLIRAALSEHAPDTPDFDAIERGRSAQFPVNAADLMPGFTGAALGEKLKELEQRWIDSGFALGKDALLAGD